MARQWRAWGCYRVCSRLFYLKLNRVTKTSLGCGTKNLCLCALCSSVFACVRVQLRSCSSSPSPATGAGDQETTSGIRAEEGT